MKEVLIMSPEEAAKIFARLEELVLDDSGINRKYLNLSYGRDPNQTLDIYLPNEGAGPFPAVFFMHGGAWAMGDKRNPDLIPFIDGVMRGYAVISVNYRLTPYIRYPDNLFDVKAAIRWAAENAETYLLDPSRVALAGASAGAHLAMMAAFTQGQAVFEESTPGETCRVLAVVDQVGPTDLGKMQSHYDESGYPRMQPPDPNVLNPYEIIIGVKTDVIPNLLRFINPIDNVHPNIPPVFIQHGKLDSVVPYQQAFELRDRIISVAGPGMAELDFLEDAPHVGPEFSSKESVDKIFSFLDRYMKQQ